MTLHDSVRDRLRAIEALLRERSTGRRRRRTAAPSPAISRLLDTLEPLEWLQWVPDPRMHQRWRGSQPLPQNLPLRLIEMAWIRPTRSQIHAGGTSAVRRAVCR